ncbi:carbon-nitrogen hydrolase family protein [Pseudomonas sp. KU26590]|uniref:carbon-nitrogen hydrolase family protein n=1 Tax=Pseudomonas sp. KU26590 TaxID=2991051 RepID=UPI00223D12F7|nr:carbon-nitrogen hydrolase family protein [Pseudomonas sp. KU26590]UZJ58714.1 carbon-nitrogen hydrolase family protein [Pseudomonas sp. KU26590]
MTNLVMCAAQYCSVAGDINVNIDRHLHIMRRAVEHGVQFLLFPELSLTGYEPTLARALAQTPDAECLQPLRELAAQSGMTTVVGLPLRQPGSENILMGALVLAADGSQSVYTKQHLHPGEEAVFSAGEGGALVDIGAEQIALSVCADVTQASHAQAAAQAGADVYASSVLISHEGYARDTALLQGYASAHSMGVLMANHGGPSGGWACAGRSAFWSAGGRLVVSAPGTGDCLVIARRRQGVWQGEVVDCLEWQ